MRRISEVILAGKDNANTLEAAQEGEDDVAELLPSMFGMGEHRRPSFETLYVTPQPPSRWPALMRGNPQAASPRGRVRL